MGLMAFPYLLRRSQDYCFKAQAILMRRLVVPWSGLKSGRKFRAGRGQWQGSRGRRRRQTQLERAPWNSFKAASFPTPEAKGGATLLCACPSSSVQPFCSYTFSACVLIILQSKSLRYHLERLCAGQKSQAGAEAFHFSASWWSRDMNELLLSWVIA